MASRTIALVTTARSEYTAQAALFRALQTHTSITPWLVVAGAHLSSAHGYTVSAIESDGLPISARLDFLSGCDDSALGFQRASARAIEMFGTWLETHKPDMIVLYGDRIELLALATAAVIARVPIAHVSGGDVTEGAIDEQVRHALTKMAHLHFPHTPLSTARVLQMGEEPWRVTQVGDPLLDAFIHGPRPSPQELEQTLNFVPDERTLVVTFHPPTHEPEHLSQQLDALIRALQKYTGSVVITAPAPDPGADTIRAAMIALAQARKHTVFVENLGGYRFRGLLFCAGAMVGNSSSGLVEAPAARLGAVNIGSRQRARERAINVIDAEPNEEAIATAIERAVSKDFRASLRDVESPYGRGDACVSMAKILSQTPERDRLLHKRFMTTD